MSGVFNCLEDMLEAENGGRRAAADAVPPSLSKESQLNNRVSPDLNKLSGSHRKTAEAIEVEIKGLAQEFGIERVGFLTLTFPYDIRDLKEAQRRFNSLQTNVLKKRYVRGMVIRERHRRGGIHFHLVVALRDDIRTGVDFEALSQRDYRSAGPALRAEWAFLRGILKGYRFGRHELLPVKSNAEGVSKYVGKYIGKHITLREASDKGAHLVSYFNYQPGQRRASSHFAWAKGPSLVWRLKLASFAAGLHVKEFQELRKLFGPRWAFHCQDQIFKQVLSGEVLRKFQLLEESKGLVTARPSHSSITERKGADQLGADHPNVLTSLETGACTRSGDEGVYTVPTTTQGGVSVPVGLKTPPVSPRTIAGRGARVVEGVGSTQRTTNQNASPCQPEAKNFPSTGKKLVAQAMAAFQAVLKVQRQRLSLESVRMQQQIGFPQLAGMEAGRIETHPQSKSLDER